MNKKGNWSHIQKMKGHKSGLETRIDEQLKSRVLMVNTKNMKYPIQFHNYSFLQT